MFSHSTPIIPQGSFQVACEKNGGSFGVGDHFGSCLGRFGGSFGIGDHLGSRTEQIWLKTSCRILWTRFFSQQSSKLGEKLNLPANQK